MPVQGAAILSRVARLWRRWLCPILLLNRDCRRRTHICCTFDLGACCTWGGSLHSFLPSVLSSRLSLVASTHRCTAALSALLCLCWMTTGPSQARFVAHPSVLGHIVFLESFLGVPACGCLLCNIYSMSVRILACSTPYRQHRPCRIFWSWMVMHIISQLVWVSVKQIIGFCWRIALILSIMHPHRRLCCCNFRHMMSRRGGMVRSIAAFAHTKKRHALLSAIPPCPIPICTAFSIVHHTSFRKQQAACRLRQTPYIAKPI